MYVFKWISIWFYMYVFSVSIFECLCIFTYLLISIYSYLSIYLSICLSVYVSIYLSIYLSIFLSIFLSFYLSIFLSIYLSFFLSFILSFCLFSVCLSVCLYLFINLSVFLFVGADDSEEDNVSSGIVDNAKCYISSSSIAIAIYHAIEYITCLHVGWCTTGLCFPWTVVHVQWVESQIASIPTNGYNLPPRFLSINAIPFSDDCEPSLQSCVSVFLCVSFWRNMLSPTKHI